MLAIFLDMETNGLNPRKHRALEIAFKILDAATMEVKASYESIIAQPHSVWEGSDPQSLKINEFHWEMLREGKSEELVSQEIIALLNSLQVRRKRAAFICQNPSFDRAFFGQLIDVDLQENMQWPYHWLDLASMYWSHRVLEAHRGNSSLLAGEMSLSKNDIAKYYHLPPESQPHRAMQGVEHLIACYKAMMD